MRVLRLECRPDSHWTERVGEEVLAGTDLTCESIFKNTCDLRNHARLQISQDPLSWEI